MSDLLKFSYQSAPVRVAVLADDEPWFVAKDVCDILGIENYRNLTALDEDEKGVHSVDTLGGFQRMLTVSESGLYALIFTSRKPEAKAFRKWVTSEVLPSMRRTGGYSAGGYRYPLPGSLPGTMLEVAQLSTAEITARYIALLEERVAELKARPAGSRRWTPEEDAELQRLAGLGWGWRAIGRALGRVQSSVQSRLKRLGLCTAGQSAAGQSVAGQSAAGQLSLPDVSEGVQL